jgi:hypothetical protein
MTVKSHYGIGLLSCVLEALICLMLVFWVVMSCGILGDTSVLEEHFASNFRAEGNLPLSLHGFAAQKLDGN